MRWHGHPKQQISRAVRGYEGRVSKRVNELCAADSMLTRVAARSKAITELAGTSGSPSWEREHRKIAAKAADKQIAEMVRKARRRGLK